MKRDDVILSLGGVGGSLCLEHSCMTTENVAGKQVDKQTEAVLQHGSRPRQSAQK